MTAIKVLFEHDLAHNYMIPDYEKLCPGDKKEEENEYEIHMLEENQIPGFMKCVRKKINGQSKYYYEITSRQSLAQICEGESLGAGDIKKILKCLYQALQQMDRYLLDVNRLVLEPECIYLDVESREASFCYLPMYENRIQDSFRMFASFLLYHLNQADTEAVLLVYEINRKVQEKNYALTEILQGKHGRDEAAPLHMVQKESFQIEKEKPGIPEQKKESFTETKVRRTEKVKKKDKKQKSDRKGQEKKTEKKAEKKPEKELEKKWVVGAVFLLIAGITTAAAWMEILTVTQAGGITFLAAGGIGYLISCDQKRKKRQEEKEGKTDIDWEMPVAEEPERKEEWEKDGNVNENVGATTVLRSGESEYEPHITLISMNSRERNSVVLLKDSYLVGKLKTKVDLWIDDEAISRIHARIQKENGEYYLCDMNSTNGTFLNGRRLDVNEKVQLHVADEITFAGVGYYVGNC